MVTRAQRERARAALEGLKGLYPEARSELDFIPEDPWRLLVSVVLSAQCSDAAVNRVTPALFRAFPDVHAFARVEPKHLEPHLKTLGLYRNKARNLVLAAQQVTTLHGAVVPREREALQRLAGVGTKSAAVIVANAYGTPVIAVDTHVGRVARRLGLTRHHDPDRVEATLTALIPRERLLEAHHTLIWHGRRVCDARTPRCHACGVEPACRKVGVPKRSLEALARAKATAEGPARR
ncbi:MAG: endonuclease III [Deltaproteobacteria bacterium]|nr:endonuclease III [Deltaproteobacteria bacterium]